MQHILIAVAFDLVILVAALVAALMCMQARDRLGKAAGLGATGGLLLALNSIAQMVWQFMIEGMDSDQITSVINWLPFLLGVLNAGGILFLIFALLAARNAPGISGGHATSPYGAPQAYGAQAYGAQPYGAQPGYGPGPGPGQPAPQQGYGPGGGGGVGPGDQQGYGAGAGGQQGYGAGAGGQQGYGAGAGAGDQQDYSGGWQSFGGGQQGYGRPQDPYAPQSGPQQAHPGRPDPQQPPYPGQPGQQPPQF